MWGPKSLYKSKKHTFEHRLKMGHYHMAFPFQLTMINKKLSAEAMKIIDKLTISEMSSYIDSSLVPLKPFQGSGEIKLIVLGQDPTVHDRDYKKRLKVTLLLNQPGRLRRYIEDICKGLDIVLDENVYATNILKNFFIVPPDTLHKSNPNFFQQAAEYWIPLLREEIEKYKNVPILSLGQPVLNCLMKTPNQVLIRNYWGFERKGQYGSNFGYIEPIKNVISRVIFPFPHLPGRKHKIYQQQYKGYLAFIKNCINPDCVQQMLTLELDIKQILHGFTR